MSSNGRLYTPRAAARKAAERIKNKAPSPEPSPGVRKSTRKSVPPKTLVQEISARRSGRLTRSNAPVLEERKGEEKRRSNKRKIEEAEEEESESDSEAPKVTSSSPPLDILRSSWKFLNIYQFCHLFADQLALGRVSIADLERGFLGESVSESLESGRETSLAPSVGSSASNTRASTPIVTDDQSNYLSSLICKLMDSFTLGTGKRSKSAHTQVYVIQFRRMLMQNTILDILALFPADTDFEDLPTFDKLELVRALCDLVLDRMVSDGVVIFEPETLRYHPIGRDSKGRTYWIFGETRLYRQRRMTKSGELEADDEDEFTFSLANWRRCMIHFAESKKSSNRHLHAALERIGTEVLESIQASELARIREEERLSKLRMMDLMPRKRSNRLEMKTKEMEQLRHEEALRRQAEELEAYKVRQQKEKEEEEKRRQQELLIETAQDLDMQVRDAIRQIESVGQTSLDAQRIHQILPDVPLMMRATRHGRASKPLAPVPTKDFKRKVLTKREDIEAQESKLKDLWSMVIQDSRPVFEQKGKGLRGIHVEKDVYDEDISDVSHIIRKHVLRKIVEMLQNLPQAEPFLEPVDPEALHIPDYFKVVKRPMDLATIHKNIILDNYLTPKSNGETAESTASRSGLFTAVIHDILLIFDNCYLYNPKGSWVDKECRALEKLAGEIFAKTFDVPEKARVNYDEDKEDQELDVTGDSPEHSTSVTHKSKRPAPKPRAPPTSSAKRAHYADKGHTAGERASPSQPINFVHYDPNQRYPAPLPYQQPPVIQPSMPSSFLQGSPPQQPPRSQLPPMQVAYMPSYTPANPYPARTSAPPLTMLDLTPNLAYSSPYQSFPRPAYGQQRPILPPPNFGSSGASYAARFPSHQAPPPQLNGVRPIPSPYPPADRHYLPPSQYPQHQPPSSGY